MADDPPRLLVIKLGALGDFVQALGPFAAIRRHHAGARVTLLTTQPYAALAAASPYFDAVWIDERPRPWRLGAWLDLRRRLKRGRFARVYDLQTSDRSSFYFRLFWPGPTPEWSGIAAGCSHPHANPRRDFMHTIERQAEQLDLAGIAAVPPPDLSWAKADLGRFAIGPRFALIAPGGAAHRPYKRWPDDRYAQLAARLVDVGVTPVLLGQSSEALSLERIRTAAPVAINLAGRTTLLDVIGLARAAALAVGNDTGPMHLAAVAGAPSLVLYSDESNPALCAQRGPSVTILRKTRLADLSVDDVASSALRLIRATAQ